MAWGVRRAALAASGRRARAGGPEPAGQSRRARGGGPEAHGQTRDHQAGPSRTAAAAGSGRLKIRTRQTAGPRDDKGLSASSRDSDKGRQVLTWTNTGP